MRTGGGFILVAVGLRFEARIAEGATAKICCGQGARLQAALEAAFVPDCTGVISFGIAGGLDPALSPGQAVVASAVVGDGARYEADAAWAARLQAQAGAIVAPIAGSAAPLISLADKTALFGVSGAACVDMESGIAASFAAARGLSFAGLRVIADSADAVVPEAALAGMGPDGTARVLPVLKQLLARPDELPALIRVARETARARKTLARVRRDLGRDLGWDFGRGFGRVDLG